MLGDAAGLALGDGGGTDGVQQRRLAMVHVAHDGDHRSAAYEVLLLLGLVHVLDGLLLVADLLGLGAKIAADVLGQLHVESLVDGGENFLLHQPLNHQVGLHTELFRELLDGDALGDDDFLVERQYGGLVAARERFEQLALAFLILLTGHWARGALVARTAALIGGRHGCGRLETSSRRGRMHGTPTDWSGRRRPGAGSRHGLARTQRASVNRLPGDRRTGRPGGHSGSGLRWRARHHYAIL